MKVTIMQTIIKSIKATATFDHARLAPDLSGKNRSTTSPYRDWIVDQSTDVCIYSLQRVVVNRKQSIIDIIRTKKSYTEQYSDITLLMHFLPF